MEHLPASRLNFFSATSRPNNYDTPPLTAAYTLPLQTYAFIHTQAAAATLLENAGTAPGGAYQATFPAGKTNSIDRIFGMNYDLPALEQTGSAGDTLATGGSDASKAALCERTWTCAKQTFDVCPGGTYTTAQVRGFATEATIGTPYHPTYSFTATAGKHYSLVFVDLLSPAWAAAAAAMPGLKNFPHFFAFNFANATELNALGGGTTAQTPFGAYVSH